MVQNDKISLGDFAPGHLFEGGWGGVVQVSKGGVHESIPKKKHDILLISKPTHSNHNHH